MVLAGCVSIQQPLRGHLESDDVLIRNCAHLLQELDTATMRGGVRDIGARRIDGFPYLRVDRFLSAFRENAGHDETLRKAWIDQLIELDTLGRRIEISNLPQDRLDQLVYTDRHALMLRIQTCAHRLATTDMVNPAAVTLLSQQARVEDDYSSSRRALGLYALTRYPFALGIEDWQQDTTRTIEAARQGEPPQLPTVVYTPDNTLAYTRAEVRTLLQQATANPLGIASLSAVQKHRLLTTYAPVFEIETDGDFDRIGSLHWRDDPTPQVDTTQPRVYTRLEHTRVNGRTLVQLVYVAWFPARPRQHALDLLGGRLDGLVWRVTLAPDGEPVLFDSIHPCGCYHMFFPTPRMQPVPAPNRIEEWAFIPATLPRVLEHQHIKLQLQTRTHYLSNVWPDKKPAGVTYRFADYHSLRSLPLPGGGTRSIFDQDGLIAGSERRERFLFWPMGIKSAGAMRQAGTQATAFVGRRHFDDADLADKRFHLLD